ncbi:hypothetical protein PAXRUDRAFT_32614 [Paxillus rubicundulus Ve08.2h10]|uniref:Amino acid permease/ SLC12A domain-containing protein n=1 Tax=Paxillus rubicundulus Ve08.2h10 TaxID=930991 RepID=A0A0D0DZN3_9AGAM|nr:hypothetical protein PAXRUDRAFT_32614 [Paxillus rubicundulus Ve08.2h10]
MKSSEGSNGLAPPNNTPERPIFVDPDKALSLHRGFKVRQISMITLGGFLGTSLIIGSGTAPVRGSLGLWFGYSFMGFTCYLVMVALGEMGAYLPHKKGFAGYATRCNYLSKYFVQTTNNANAAGAVLQYWTLTVMVFSINLSGIPIFGEFEFWFCSIKVIALAGLILMGLIIDLGGNPHDRIGFRYWNPPNGPLSYYLVNQVHNKQLSQLLGFWSTLTTALFSYIATELIGITVGEIQNPRKAVSKVIKRMFFPMVVFYIGGTFVIGSTVPSTNKTLFVVKTSTAGATSSPFLVGHNDRVINHVINAVVLIFVPSAANSDLYIGLGTLYGLAVERKAPRIFAKVSRMGVPWPALIPDNLVCFLTFLNASPQVFLFPLERHSLPVSYQAFGWFSNLIASFGGITWICIAYTHMSYIAIPIFIVPLVWAGYKIFFQTSTIRAAEVDLHHWETGNRR